MQPVQIKMARAALDLTVDELAAKAGVSHVDILNLETGGSPDDEALTKTRVAFEAAGIEWIGDDGVRFNGTSAAATIPLEDLNSANDE